MRSIFVTFVAILFSATSVGHTVEEDVNAYLAIFKGDPSAHSMAVQDLSWKGISDPRLYDVIEQRLLADAQSARSDKIERARANSYIRALGFSGQAKYIPTLHVLLDDAMYKESSVDAERDILKYQKWNPVISNRATFDARYSDDVNRGLNMLHSSDMGLKRLGAMQVYSGLSDNVLFDTLAEEIKKFAFVARVPSSYSDPIAWMVKSLGRSNQEDHNTLLIEVKQTCTDHSIARQARKALEHDETQQDVAAS